MKDRDLFPVLIEAPKEVADVPRDFIGCLVEREMPRFQHVNLGFRYISGIGCRSGHGEGGIVFSPDDQCWRLRLAKPFLPQRVRRDVGPIVKK